jgi:hypothetical protein
MAQLTKRLATLLATIVLATTLLASSANAAVPASDARSMAVVPADPAQTLTVDGNRPERDGDHHRRFCVKLNAVLSRLVEKNVITLEQKLRITEAFDCVPKPTTTKPTTTEPTSTRSTAAR